MSQNRYCGKCGEKVSKKKLFCQTCEISVEEFKEPYNKLPLPLMIFLLIFYTVLIILYASIIIRSGIIFSSIWGVVLFVGFHIFIIILTIRAINVKQKGIWKCSKCNKEVSLKAKYCIYCGNRYTIA